MAGLLMLMSLGSCDVGDPNAPVYHRPGDPRGSSTGGIVAGHVVGPEGEAVEGAEVSFDRKDGLPHGGVGIGTLEDGTFEVDLEPTRYVLTIRADGYATYRVEIDVEAGQRYDLEIEMQAA